MKDKTILLVRLMNNVERRFNDDQELVAQFLKLVNYIYRFVLFYIYIYRISQYFFFILLLEWVKPL